MMNATAVPVTDKSVPPNHEQAKQIVMLAMSDLVVEDQTRLNRDEAHIASLEADYAERQKVHPGENPIQTPLRVIRRGSKYPIIAGTNRFLAGLRRGLTHAPCIILPHDMDAAQLLIEQVRDNSQHKGYTPLEDARNIIELRRLRPELTQREAARLLGLDVSKANKVLKIINYYPPEFHPLIGENEGMVPFTTAYALAQLMEKTGDEAKVRQLTEKAKSGALKRDAAFEVVRPLLNKDKKGKRKAVKITVAGVTMVFKEKIVDAWRSVRATMDEAIKKLEKEGLPEEVIPALLK